MFCQVKSHKLGPLFLSQIPNSSSTQPTQPSQPLPPSLQRRKPTKSPLSLPPVPISWFENFIYSVFGFIIWNRKLMLLWLLVWTWNWIFRVWTRSLLWWVWLNSYGNFWWILMIRIILVILLLGDLIVGIYLIFSCYIVGLSIDWTPLRMLCWWCFCRLLFVRFKYLNFSFDDNKSNI